MVQKSWVQTEKDVGQEGTVAFGQSSGLGEGSSGPETVQVLGMKSYHPGRNQWAPGTLEGPPLTGVHWQEVHSSVL